MNKRPTTTRAILIAILVFASISTVGSLYLSLGLGLIPCRLCWYQRILMYPLTVVTGVAIIRNDGHAWMYILPLSILGGIIATYHSFIQRFGEATCSPSGGCSAILYTIFGLSIPNLALIGFVGITIGSVLLFIRSTSR